MDLFQEFWAPTPFVARALRQLTAKPVRIVPPYLPHLAILGPRSEHVRKTPHFVYCFDANSVIERKNPESLLNAFLDVFPSPADARLTFKVTHPKNRQRDLEVLYKAAHKYENIEVIDRLLTDIELSDLIKSSTAYVSPHRAEGLGLTIVEAMAQGVAVIATSFGGVENLITSETAWPIAYRLTELTEAHAPYPQGYVWATPDVCSLKAALRDVVSLPSVARDRASAARRLALEEFASPTVIQKYRTALEQSASIIGLPSP